MNIIILQNVVIQGISCLQRNAKNGKQFYGDDIYNMHIIILGDPPKYKQAPIHLYCLWGTRKDYDSFFKLCITLGCFREAAKKSSRNGRAIKRGGG